jgi:hypothetical protein
MLKHNLFSSSDRIQPDIAYVSFAGTDHITFSLLALTEDFGTLSYRNAAPKFADIKRKFSNRFQYKISVCISCLTHAHPITPSPTLLPMSGDW